MSVTPLFDSYIDRYHGRLQYYSIQIDNLLLSTRYSERTVMFSSEFFSLYAR